MPSWTGLCSYIFISLAIVGTLVVISHFDGSLLDKQLNSWHTAVERIGSSDPYGLYPDTPSLLEDSINLALSITFWGSAAALLYFFIAGLVQGLNNAAGVKHRPRHVHSQPLHIVATGSVHIVARGLLLCLLLLGIGVFIKIIVEYVLGATYIMGVGTSWLEAVGAILLSLSLLIMGLHMMVVVLRLFLLRPRLLGGTRHDESE